MLALYRLYLYNVTIIQRFKIHTLKPFAAKPWKIELKPRLEKHKRTEWFNRPDWFIEKAHFSSCAYRAYTFDDMVQISWNRNSKRDYTRNVRPRFSAWRNKFYCGSSFICSSISGGSFYCRPRGGVGSEQPPSSDSDDYTIAQHQQQGHASGYGQNLDSYTVPKVQVSGPSNADESASIINGWVLLTSVIQKQIGGYSHILIKFIKKWEKKRIYVSVNFN